MSHENKLLATFWASFLRHTQLLKTATRKWNHWIPFLALVQEVTMCKSAFLSPSPAFHQKEPPHLTHPVLIVGALGQEDRSFVNVFVMVNPMMMTKVILKK